MRQFTMIILLGLAALMMAACGGGGGGGSADGGGTDNTVPESASAPTLAQSVTSNDGITVRYPAGWSDPIATTGIFVFNRDTAAGGIFSNRMDAGNIYIQINKTPLVGEAPAQLTTLLSQIPAELSAPADLPGGNGIYTTGSAENIAVLGALITTESGGVVFIGYSNPAELAQNQALFLAMIDSLSIE